MSSGVQTSFLSRLVHFEHDDDGERRLLGSQGRGRDEMGLGTDVLVRLREFSVRRHAHVTAHLRNSTLEKGIALEEETDTEDEGSDTADSDGQHGGAPGMASDARGGVPLPRAPSRRAARHAMERWVVLERLSVAVARMEDGSESGPMDTTTHPRVRRVMGPDPAGTPVGHRGSVSAHRSGAPGIVPGGEFHS